MPLARFLLVQRFFQILEVLQHGVDCINEQGLDLPRSYHTYRSLRAKLPNNNLSLSDTLPYLGNSAKWWVFVADDLGRLGPGIPDLVTELCPPQDTA